MEFDVWDSSRWLESFREASRLRDSGELHALRREVFRSTVEIVKKRGYPAATQFIELDEDGDYDRLQRGTVFYPSTELLAVANPARERFDTVVEVVDKDCLEVASDFVAAGARPAVLNMASRRNPGGGVHRGDGAQEENVFRRSNLLWSLYQFVDYAAEYGVPRDQHEHAYPIPRKSGGIYSPDAKIFRSSEATGYALLDAPYEVSFISVPAINRPGVVRVGDETVLTPEMIEPTRVKIRAILAIAAQHDHVDLVLSAFGCGAFRNPPGHVARLFRDVLREDGFRGVFRRIVFAILDDHNSFRATNPIGNFEAFRRVFAGEDDDAPAMDGPATLGAVSRIEIDGMQLDIPEQAALNPWVKVVEMLQQNWAVILDDESTVRVVFFDDGRGVFDVMTFGARRDAERALRRNGFSRYWEDHRLHDFIAVPSGEFHVRLWSTGRIYSSGRFWVG